MDITGYKYFIIMNSSVRGPFTPAYYTAKQHWSRIFTDKITDEVKLVGPTISCEGAPMEGGRIQGMAHQPTRPVLCDGNRSNWHGSTAGECKEACMLLLMDK